MTQLDELLREYGEILEQERRLAERKEALRRQIHRELTDRNLTATRTPHGDAKRTTRFKLTPRREPILGLLRSEDLFPFAHFTPAKVKTILVPKYGREALYPLFEIEKVETLFVTRPPRSPQPRR